MDGPSPGIRESAQRNLTSAEFGLLRETRIVARREASGESRMSAESSFSIRRRFGAGGRNRTGTGLAALRIFVPATAFAAPLARVWGLDYTFALA